MKRKRKDIEPEAPFFTEELLAKVGRVEGTPLFGDDGPIRDPLVVRAEDANVDRDPILAAIQAEARARGDVFRGLAEIALEWKLSPVAILTEAIAKELRHAARGALTWRGRTKNIRESREWALVLHELEAQAEAVDRLIKGKVTDVEEATKVFDEAFLPAKSAWGSHVDELLLQDFAAAVDTRRELAARALEKIRRKGGRRDNVQIAIELWREDGLALPGKETATARSVMAALKRAEAEVEKYDDETVRDGALQSPGSREFDRRFEAATKALHTRSR